MRPVSGAPGDRVEVCEQWLELLARLREAPGRAIVCGPPDSGKSTLCWWLAERLGAQGPVAIVDADLGQSRIGLPACVGWQMLGGRRVEAYFVGDVTPATRPLACLEGTVRLAARAAAAGARWTIVDTSGWVDGPAAMNLKHAKVELLAPTTLVAIGDPNRLEAITAPWRNNSRVRAERLRPLAPRAKGPGERAQWRADAFGRALAGGALRWVDLSALALTNVPPPDTPPEALDGLLVGFHDAEGLMTHLGLLKALDASRCCALVRCAEGAPRAAGIRFGLIQLEPDGTPRRCA